MVWIVVCIIFTLILPYFVSIDSNKSNENIYR